MRYAAKTMTDNKASSLVGKTLDRYQVLSLLGSGGMGEVYLAEDTRLNRKVAIKFLPAELTTNRGDRLRRFEQEAHAASALNHPNILTIYEIGTTDSARFIVTEFIDGLTLRQRMEQSALHLQEALDIAIYVASALVAAHRVKIVHRDIKPENIMVRRDDSLVKVLDFGLAKSTQKRSDAAADPEAQTRALVNTAPGMVMGTVAYMSPEQARGLAVDERTDIWSVGVVLYEMISGKVPFSGTGANEVISGILSREQPAPLTRFAHNLPSELDRIVTKALAKDREERYQSTKDLLIDLKRLRQKLVIDEEIERSIKHEAGAAGATANASEQASATLIHEPAAVTSAPSLNHPVTSAEYIVSEIKHHIRGILFALALMIIAGAGVGLWLYSTRSRSTFSSQAMKITRLTSTGKATNAAISPDGKYVVYSMDDAGQQSLWLSQVAISSHVQIVPSARVSYSGITFSRDGNLIYYVRNEQGGGSVLYQAPALGGGGERKVLVDVHSPISFSPDGKRLAFVRRYPASPGGDALMVANADGTEEKILLTRKKSGLLGYNGPAWSPDGKIIACGDRNYSGDSYSRVVGVQVADGTEIPITSQRWEVSSVGRVEWLANGDGLLVTAAEVGILPQIWHLPYPGDGAVKLFNDLNGYGDLSLTSDSSALVTVRSDRLVNIWVAPNGDASQAKQITSGAGREDGAFLGIGWTPDSKIVYSSMAGDDPNIWMISADGVGNKQLSVNTFQTSFPSASPDGRYLFWVAKATDTAAPEIWRMDIDGGNPKQLTHTGGSGVWFPQLSPDGQWMVYGTIKAELGHHSLWKVTIDGGVPIQLTDKPSWRPVISPDGKRIACHRLDEGQWKIALLPFEGGMPIRIFNNSGVYNRPILWTPDGRAVAFIRTTEGVSNLFTQPLDGGEPQKLTDFKDQRIFNFAWSRDGKQLALSRGVVNSDVVLITNFK
jgi:serine/threonine protein kinase/dipeptidyl aminopeptidase/acylaminoacyl peptidase